jgi:hypothetical protein
MVAVSVGTDWAGLGGLLPTKGESACWLAPAGSRPAGKEEEVFCK